ncbi:hypothetical protein GGI21_005437, partial [Coemansia aciculifera]
MLTAPPYVPASFIDFSKSAMTAMSKRMRGVERSGLRRGALLANRRHTSSVSVPAPEQQRPSFASGIAPSSLKPAAVSEVRRASSAAEKPTITAVSLGLEARRSFARGQSLQQRKRTSIYYGSGYGSGSSPYDLDFTHSTPAPAVLNTRPAHEAGASDGATSARSGSITAQKILDIIGEVPPTRSQASLDHHNVINPYELASPYSVRMRPPATQRRHVLMPLSMSLSHSSSADSAKTVTQHADDNNSNSTRAILESIQSAAPPEVQAGLGSKEVLKPIQNNRQTPKRYLPPPLPTKKAANAQSPTAKKVVASQSPGVASPKYVSKTLSSTSPSTLAARLAAKGQPAPTPLDQLAKAATEPVDQAPKQPFSLGGQKLVAKTMAAVIAASTPLPKPPVT